jgi:hypothetical protein
MNYDRVLRAELFQSERYLDLTSDTARLIYIALLSIADDFGNLRGGERRLFRWAQTFAQVKDSADVVRIMCELCDCDLARRYTIGNDAFFHLPRFQNLRTYCTRLCPPSPWCDPDAPTGPYKAGNRPVDRRAFRVIRTTKASRARMHADTDVRERLDLDKASTKDDTSVTTNKELPQPIQPLTLVPDSDMTQDRLRSGSHLNLGVGVGEKKRASVAHRLPDAWTLDPGWSDWAIAYASGLGVSLTARHVQRIADCFADHWHSMPGPRGTRADWLATWRNWIRREDLAKLARAGPDDSQFTNAI